jgi:hypothetical protein
VSGGSHEYAYLRVEEFANDIRGDSPLRRAFAEHLDTVAHAMHAIEWVDSCDYGKGDDGQPIRDALAPGAELKAATSMAKDALDTLAATIARAEELSQ